MVFLGQIRQSMNHSEVSGMFKCRVVDNQVVGPAAYYLSFERPFEFEAGQVISLTLDEQIPPRLYSIASGVDDPALSILFDVKPDGLLTPQLAKLQKGDWLFVSPPYGSFIGSSEPAVWVATGTGVAPFISMARSGLGIGKLLVQGARATDGFYFSDYFFDYEGLEYVRCLSSGAAAGIYEGRLTSYLSGSTSIPLNEKYYLCGNPLMVNEVRDLLISKGVPFENILSEIFF